MKWRFLTILQAISNSDRYARNIIPVSIVSLIYAEHVLRMPVDWSTLPSTRFGRLSKMYLTRKPAQIPYIAVPVWFRSDPALLDDPESPILANRERGHGQDLIKGDEFLPTMSWIEILELHLLRWR
jgi:hypothetical protein